MSTRGLWQLPVALARSPLLCLLLAASAKESSFETFLLLCRLRVLTNIRVLQSPSNWCELDATPGATNNRLIAIN